VKSGSDLATLARRRNAVTARGFFAGALCALAIGLGLIRVPRGACADTADRSLLLLLLLPQSDEVRPWAPEASAQLAEGQGLFALINGGAEIFLRHGFERAVAQTYSHAGGRHIQVEIYMMRTTDGAAEVFLRRTGATEPPLAIGDAGVRGEYYVVFRKGRCFVTVTAGDTIADEQAMVLRIARAIEHRIPATCP
jgi:hypothetical protein